jgi:SEC-C motif-containing protein
VSEPCLCGSGRVYDACCGPLIEGKTQAESPEALMRSRYVAFCRVDLRYLAETHDPRTRADFDVAANEAWAREARFTGLEIKSSWQQGERGEVVFRARFELQGRSQIHAERSRFRREGGRWYFVDGRDPT